MRHSPSVLLLIALASFACGADSALPSGSDENPAEPPPSENQALSFEVIPEVHGTQISSIRDRRRTVIRTAKEWQEFWDEFTAATIPPPELPAIDFAARMVIVAAMGERTTGGYSIAIEDVTEGDDGVTARVVETSPGASCLLSQVITAPVTAVSVTRREGSVTFDEDTQTQQCASLSFQVIEEVHNTVISGIRERRRTVIDNGSDWEEFWNEFATAVDAPPDPPAVDFDMHMVIVAAMGERLTSGYAIAIEEVTESEDGVTARVVETSPENGCVLAQVVTAPVTAVTITRHDRSTVFVEETRSQEC